MSDEKIKQVNIGDKDERKAEIEKFKREMGYMVELTKEVAKLRFAEYKAYVDAGFTEEQSLKLITGVK